MNDKMRRKNNRFIILFLILGIIGFILISYNYFLGKVDNVFNEFNYQLYNINSKNQEENVLVVEDIITENITSDDENKNENENNNNKVNKVINYNYIAYLNIPKINLKQGLVSINSKYNKVSKNVQIIESSNMPDVVNGNLILAGHSGYGYLAFFKNLYKLKIGDEANILYKEYNYIYKIVNIYTVPKTGQISINRNKDVNTLTLITCTKDDDKSQTVYIAELDRKEVINQWILP